MHLQPVPTLPLRGEIKCECCTLIPFTPLSSQNHAWPTVVGDTPKIYFSMLAHRSTITWKTAYNSASLEDGGPGSRGGCPVLRAHALAEARRGPAGACSRGGERRVAHPHDRLMKTLRGVQHGSGSIPGFLQCKDRGVSTLQGQQRAAGQPTEVVRHSSGKKTQRGRFSSGDQTCSALYS